MNRTQHTKITALLHRLRSWERGTAPLDVLELATHYGLDEFIVRRVGESEGVHFCDDEAVPVPVYDWDDTQPIRLAI